jgi:hypothetical protein
MSQFKCGIKGALVSPGLATGNYFLENLVFVHG